MVATTDPARVPNAPEVLECQVCEFPVDPATGFLAVDVHEAQAAARGERYPVRWEPIHGPCCDTAPFYAIDLHDLANPRRILWWTAHLRGKNWTAGTDWLSYVAREGRYF